ncbi:MAG: hypothetical protein QM754_16700 [Tepidisphaeraceae bacterium]
MSLRSFENRGTETKARALLEGLEDRKLMASTPTIIGIKIAKAADTDNTALNQNRITIAFSGTIRLGDVNQFSSFGYANDLSDYSQQVKKRVGMTITQPASNYIQIITDRLIRKGSRLTILSGGLTDKNGTALIYDATTAAKTITFNVGQNKMRYSLSNRNFVASDLSYFDPDVFTSAPTPTTASTTPSSATIRANLVTFLNKKVSAGIITSAQASAAITNYYDSSTVAAIIPNANLRAALASLVGTAAEPAIASYIGKTNVTGKQYTLVDFGTVSSGTPVGETKLSPGGRLNLTINSAFAGEPFQVLSATLAHEALHQDAANNSGGDLPSSQDEEIIANAVETIVYAQQLLVDGSIAGNGTKLVVRTNTRLLALLNSGDGLFPYGGIKQDPALYSNGNVFVGAKANPGGFGSTTVKSFEDWIRREYVFRGFSAGATTNSAVGQAILKNIVGSSYNVTQLGTTTETALDVGNTLLTDVNYIKLAITLKLSYGA